MMVDEVNKSITKKVDNQSTELSIEIAKSSNFHWGAKKEEQKAGAAADNEYVSRK